MLKFQQQHKSKGIQKKKKENIAKSKDQMKSPETNPKEMKIYELSAQKSK